MIVLAIHAAATWFMVGLIWMVQVVHYPLFAAVGAGRFREYEHSHTKRMGALLIAPATIEIISGALLVFFKPSQLALAHVVVAGAFLAAIWVVTALVQYPLHRRLMTGFEPTLVQRLVATNWWRTVGWTIRGALVLTMVLVAL